MSAVTRVAVGFDGSPEAQNALAWAASLCTALNASLKIVHAVGLLEEAHLAPTLQPSAVEIQRLASEAGLSPDRVEWSVVEGSPAEALLRASVNPVEIDLLVVGSRGAGQKVGTVLGSTSLEVAQRATVPVAVIPPKS